MKTAAIITALDKVAEGFAELSLALAQQAIAHQLDTALKDDLPPLPSADETPTVYEEEPEFVDTPAGRSAQGGCPIHHIPWTVRPGGFSQNKQKSYKAFWKCDGQDEDGTYCALRPALAWVKAHPAR